MLAHRRNPIRFAESRCCGVDTGMRLLGISVREDIVCYRMSGWNLDEKFSWVIQRCIRNPPAAAMKATWIKKYSSVLLGEGVLRCHLWSCRFHHGSVMLDRSWYVSGGHRLFRLHRGVPHSLVQVFAGIWWIAGRRLSIQVVRMMCCIWMYRWYDWGQSSGVL